MTDNPVLAKLRMKAGQRAIILEAPQSYSGVMKDVSAGIQLASTLEGEFDFIHYFASDRAELERRAPALRAAMKADAILWVSYPKGTAIPTNLKRDIVRESMAAFGLQAVSQVAIDDVWSALRFKRV